MMKQSDLATLREMKQQVDTLSPEGLCQVAERLLRLRDRLSFDDASWYHDLTQYVATLDSASTFHPTNDAEKSQLDTAVQHAVHQISRLIGVKTV